MKDSKAPCFELKVRSFVDAIEKDLPAPIPTSQIIYNQAILSTLKKSADMGGVQLNVEIPEV